MKQTIRTIRNFLNIIGAKSLGMTFIRKFGASPVPGKTVIVLMTMIAVPDKEAERITGEMIAPTAGSFEYGKDGILLYVSTVDGKDLSDTSLEISREIGELGSSGATFDDLATSSIWRFG